MKSNSIKAISRDMDASPFSTILATLEDTCPGFEAAVFYDSIGETIDYYSYLDPFDTRLTAAHLGVVISQAVHQFAWLEFGDVKVMEIYADEKESVTLVLGDGLFLSIVMAAGNLNKTIYRHLLSVTAKLKEEVGL